MNLSNRPNRKSIRLKNYDYSFTSMYFVTICTNDKRHVFGAIVNGKMYANSVGMMLESVLHNLVSLSPQVLLDEYIVMPNHVHFLIFIANSKENSKLELSEFIRKYKSMTSKCFRDMDLRDSFGKPLWQRNYWERVMREGEIENFREYIFSNPQRWELKYNM